MCVGGGGLIIRLGRSPNFGVHLTGMHFLVLYICRPRDATFRRPIWWRNKPRGADMSDLGGGRVGLLCFFEWGVYALSASKAIFRARTYNSITYSVR